MSRELKTLLEDKDKKIPEAKTALSKLWRQILRDHNVGVARWNQLVQEFFRSKYSRTAKNTKDIGQDRNNLSRAIAKDDVSWYNFMRALMILRPVTIKIDITLTWRNKKSTVHTVDIRNPVAELDVTPVDTPDTGDASDDETDRDEE